MSIEIAEAIEAEAYTYEAREHEPDNYGSDAFHAGYVAGMLKAAETVREMSE